MRTTIHDAGNLDAADGIKSIALSYLQFCSLFMTFPILWPDIFVSFFQIGGAVTVLGQHLVDLKCMFKDNNEATSFYTFQVIWALRALHCGVLQHRLLAVVPISCCKVQNWRRSMSLTVVALLYLIWPGLCSQCFALFACRSYCDEGTFLQVSMEEPCWAGRHLAHVLGIGLPVAALLVFGLPAG